MGIHQGHPRKSGSPQQLGLQYNEVRRHWLMETHPTLTKCPKFADDLILFSEATVEQTKVMDCLSEFCTMSGQKLNFQKSHIFFSSTVSSILASEIVKRIEISQTDILGRYLGVPSLHGRTGKVAF